MEASSKHSACAHQLQPARVEWTISHLPREFAVELKQRELTEPCGMLELA